MKIALVHDYIKEYGGAERVLETLHEMYPEASVFTSVYLPEFLGPHRERFAGWDIRTSWLQYIPFKHKLISPFRLLAPLVFWMTNLSKYDVVIVSATGAYFPNFVRTTYGSARKKKPLHICYCHTPPRYLYGYATARDWKRNKVFAFLGAIANHFLRMVDFVASKHVDYYIANSEEVAGRIKKFYRRDAKVVYPAVEIPNSKFQIPNKSQITNSKSQKEGYYLTGGRLARAKHVDLIVGACDELGAHLKVFGRGFVNNNIKNQISKIKKVEGDKEGVIEFLGEVSDDKKYELMRNAKAFIFAGEDEDFGIVPVEAMACGTPVIAYKSGGVRETVVEGITGVFFAELHVGSLKEAIRKFEEMELKREDCRRQAGKFSKERFVREITVFIDSIVRK